MKSLLHLIVIALLAHVSLKAQWVQTSGPSGGAVSQFALNATNGHVYALSNNGVYRSINNGATWTPVTNSLPGDAAFFAIAAGGTNVYIGTVSFSDTKIVYRSTDNGETWTLTNGTGLPSFGSVGALMVLGSSLLAHVSSFISGTSFYVSTNGGDNWTASNSGMPANVTIAYLTTKGSDIYAASSITSSVKGVFRSTDNAASWTTTGLVLRANCQVIGTFLAEFLADTNASAAVGVVLSFSTVSAPDSGTYAIVDSINLVTTGKVYVEYYDPSNAWTTHSGSVKVAANGAQRIFTFCGVDLFVSPTNKKTVSIRGTCN